MPVVYELKAAILHHSSGISGAEFTRLCSPILAPLFTAPVPVEAYLEPVPIRWEATVEGWQPEDGREGVVSSGPLVGWQGYSRLQNPPATMVASLFSWSLESKAESAYSRSVAQGVQRDLRSAVEAYGFPDLLGPGIIMRAPGEPDPMAAIPSQRLPSYEPPPPVSQPASTGVPTWAKVGLGLGALFLISQGMER